MTASAFSASHWLDPTSQRRNTLLPPGRWTFLDRLVALGLLDAEDGELFLTERQERLREYTTDEKLGQALIHANLLTIYQLSRCLSGQTHGLVLGNYRVLEELGRGGMGTVFLCEHRLMKRRVAIKVVPVDDDCPPAIKHRFYAEMRVLAELSHPNIILALDAGEVSPTSNQPTLIFLAMEYIQGGDLEQQTIRQGICSLSQACGYIRQAAAGLQAAHDRHIIHRDIKPSNLLVNSVGQIKLVDFGLVRHFSSRLTDQRSLLGSVEFMPPEQSHDPSAVGKEADIYGLGATLFWLLSGEGPYPHAPHVGQALRILQQQPPRRLRSLRGDIPEQLDELVARMLDRNPANRPTSPLAVSNFLRPFVLENKLLITPGKPISFTRTANLRDSLFRVLIVDDDLKVRVLHRLLMEQLGCECDEAANGVQGLELAGRNVYDLVLLDLILPDVDGYEVCKQLREKTLNPSLKIIIVSGKGDNNELADSLPRGADDYVVKPFENRQLLAKVRHALELKTAQDHATRLADQLLQVNQQLEQSLRSRTNDLHEAHNALLFAMAKVAESRDGETPGHLKRMQLYSRTLALEAAAVAGSPWHGLVDERFLEQMNRCVPLHDIGKIGLPDDILLKPASLTPSERALVETHPLIGDTILESLAKEYGTSLEFLGMARVIVRHHHERYDGKGYPDRLVGDAIPPAARLVAVADVYDALRRMRLYKPAMKHTTAIRLMVEGSPGQFDPTLAAALSRCHGEFERIYREIEE